MSYPGPLAGRRSATLPLELALDTEQGDLAASLGRLLRPPRRTFFDSCGLVEIDNVGSVAHDSAGAEVRVVRKATTLAEEDRLALAVFWVPVSATSAGQRPNVASKADFSLERLIGLAATSVERKPHPFRQLY